MSRSIASLNCSCAITIAKAACFHMGQVFPGSSSYDAETWNQETFPETLCFVSNCAVWAERTAGQHLGGEKREAVIMKSGTGQRNKLFVMDKRVKVH